MERITRRDFLKLAALGLGALAWTPLRPLIPPEADQSDLQPEGWGRVTIWAIGVFRTPSYQSERVRIALRDEILPLYFTLHAAQPAHNPRWYRTDGGYVHSAYIQRVEKRLNGVPAGLPDRPLLGEVTVPYLQAQRYTRTYGWVPVYRLYYQSVHWVTGLDEGPDGTPWYRLRDDLLKVEYHVPAAGVRLIPEEELAPLSPDVPWEAKRIEVSLKEQTLIAYEGEKAVRQCRVSTGIPNSRPTRNGIPTRTPSGTFRVHLKMPVRHMGDGALTSALDAYELPGVPWVCFFTDTGVAFHGTYWHDNFGTPMSHGCVNLPMEDARWVFRWSTPVNYPPELTKKGFGTLVIVS